MSKRDLRFAAHKPAMMRVLERRPPLCDFVRVADTFSSWMEDAVMSPRFAYSRLRPLLYDPIRRMRRRRTRRATPRRLALEPLESRFLLIC